MDQIFAEEVNGQTRWTLTDHLGSVRDVVSDTGVTLGRITYDSFGQATNTTGIVDTLFRYTARPSLATTGLYDYRARIYDPRVGQFASEDPIGFGGGDSNLRRYVGNEPTGYTDPSGLRQDRAPTIGPPPPYWPSWRPYQWYDDPWSPVKGTVIGKWAQDNANARWERELAENRERWEADQARKRRAEAAGRHPSWQLCIEDGPALLWEMLNGLGSARGGGGSRGVQGRPGGRGGNRPSGSSGRGPIQSRGGEKPTTPAVPTPGRPLGQQSLVDNLSKGSFDQKIARARDLVREAKAADPKFIAQEARSVNGDFLFIGSGRQPGLKNVLIIRKDGSVLRMELDSSKIKPVQGGGTKIFDVDLSCAELVVP